MQSRGIPTPKNIFASSEKISIENCQIVYKNDIQFSDEESPNSFVCGMALRQIDTCLISVRPVSQVVKAALIMTPIVPLLTPFMLLYLDVCNLSMTSVKIGTLMLYNFLLFVTDAKADSARLFLCDIFEAGLILAMHTQILSLAESALGEQTLAYFGLALEEAKFL
jgi:hypothetical protein